MIPTSTLLLLAAAPAFVSAANATAHPAIQSPLLGYEPSNVLTTIATAFVALVAVGQVWLTVKYPAKWLLAMTFGCFTYAIGLASRFALASDGNNRTVFIAEYLLIALSPCTFIAASYVLLGRLVRYLRADKYLFIRATLVSIIFVMADVITFLIQAMGGALAVGSDDPDRIKLGGNLFKLGIILQLVSFAFFILLVVIFTIRLYRNDRSTWTADRDAGKSFMNDWRVLLIVLYVSCVTIVTRSFYRAAESEAGPRGKIATTEWIFYAFDTLPLCICIATYVPFWPGRFITSQHATPGTEAKSVPLEDVPQYNSPLYNGQSNTPYNQYSGQDNGQYGEQHNGQYDGQYTGQYNAQHNASQLPLVAPR